MGYAVVMEANRGWFGKIGPRGGLMGHGSVVGGSWWLARGWLGALCTLGLKEWRV